MALIACPECGKKLSSKASACPNCGYPMELYWKEQKEKAQEAEAQQREECADLLAHQAIDSPTEDAVLSVKESASDFSLKLRRNLRCLKVDPSEHIWICAGCKAVLYDTSGSPIGGKKRQWDIASVDQVGNFLWLTFVEDSPLQKYKVPKMRVFSPANKDIYTEQERENFCQAIKEKFLAAREEPTRKLASKENSHESDKTVVCPRCGSSSIQVVKKGFSFGKAAAGGLLLGPVGLVGGAIGSNDLQRVCLNCGTKF